MAVKSLAFISTVNNEDVLKNNLLRSSCIKNYRSHLIIERGYDSASKAYNAAFNKSDADVLVCIHQDVYLPDGWDQRLLNGIKHLEESGESWGVIGVWGINVEGGFHGRVWCSGGNREHIGNPAHRSLHQVVSVDEIVIVINSKAGIRFDDDLPGFHMYATDICLQAAENNYKTFVIDAPVVHNSKSSPVIDPSYYPSYRYMQHKWRHKLPILTCVLPITTYGIPVIHQRCRDFKRRYFNANDVGHRHLDPAQLAKELGYE